MGTSTSGSIGPSRILRFVQFPVTRILIAAACMIAVIALLQVVATVTHFAPDSGPKVLLAVMLTLVVLMGTYATYVRLIERRPVTELATQRAAPEFAVGFLIGGALFCVIMLILWLAGVAEIEKGAGWAALWMPLLSGFELAVLQAIFVCGILFRIAEGGLGTWIALAVTIIVFGAMHAGSPGASLISEAAIGVEAGTLLAASYVHSRRLWLPMGLLTAWNFVESGVFGVSVFGHTELGLLASRFHGAPILTGGPAGPEISIVSVLVCVAVAVMVLLDAFHKGNIIEPFWRRTSGPTA